MINPDIHIASIVDDLFNTTDVVFVSKDYAKSQGHKSKEESVQRLYSRCREG